MKERVGLLSEPLTSKENMLIYKSTRDDRLELLDRCMNDFISGDGGLQMPVPNTVPRRQFDAEKGRRSFWRAAVSTTEITSVMARPGRWWRRPTDNFA
jgi:hypothetical protein